MKEHKNKAIVDIRLHFEYVPYWRRLRLADYK